MLSTLLDNDGHIHVQQPFELFNADPFEGMSELHSQFFIHFTWFLYLIRKSLLKTGFLRYLRRIIVRIFKNGIVSFSCLSWLWVVDDQLDAIDGTIYVWILLYLLLRKREVYFHYTLACSCLIFDFGLIILKSFTLL